ncbi:protein immune deficiency [Lucilia cuprina]|uniref:protein immune deficiency n=1 Tax=Lucilia cuprina TaxID=7375 RepID=UPI001F06FF62|nr:protein immune deficiency [Lucilia cuprina]
MFFFKKFFSSFSKNIKDNCTHGRLEEDAIPVEHASSNLVLTPQTQISNSDYSEVRVPESNAMNVNNVNQQVVVQFSNINGLQIGSTYNINKTNICKPEDKCENAKLKKNERCKYPKTITIDAMMKSQDEPCREMLNEIATHLGSDYKQFMRDLGFSEGQISAKTIDNNVYGVKEIIYQLLLDWLRNSDGEGTVGFLITKLWNSGHRECVYRLKSTWKSKGLAKTNDGNDYTVIQ